ncbi:DNA (cytosine-5-)-methyltransferase [Jeotgalibaca porci]|uniref:Cytosine-specific methyltransferase n=1 Tax=Jeotgalibaca porci TaxID=1868793 RepID=A0A6G7WIA8_9LACT|nr:DNA (cytosine-5-)-methyltransferase [Jeotgalibaca porci]QIK51982.1 DNA (cytosine-5-)-methyltransferase [Jeotgalibaca porci]
MTTKPLHIFEMFAGVGGFRVGLERADENLFQTKWANQWEPSKKAQEAFDCYDARFPDSLNLNEDISEVPDSFYTDKEIDMIVGGFPCQDYSVARSLSGELGIQGKKGVLFWEIVRAIELSNPKYVLLENVDRLLKSPSTQRGRDFSIMLGAFNNLGYSVQWRVINAAEYGFAQRRRRVFIFAYRNDDNYSKKLAEDLDENIIFSTGLFAELFPVQTHIVKKRHAVGTLSDDIVDISDSFSTPIFNTGIMRDGKFTTIETEAVYVNPTTLGEILVPEETVDEKYYLSPEQLEKFVYLKGPKKIKRTSATGHEYIFSEGSMSLTDSLEKPGRTMLTSEASINRSTHIVEVDGRIRFLTPVECERLNGFPDDWTNTMHNRMRYFCMGNALVTGVIERLGQGIAILEANPKN